jgi:hypothetical protein
MLYLILVSKNLYEIELNQEGTGSRSGKPCVRERVPENGRQVGLAGLGEVGRPGPMATFGDSFRTSSGSVHSAPMRVVVDTKFWHVSRKSVQRRKGSALYDRWIRMDDRVPRSKILLTGEGGVDQIF